MKTNVFLLLLLIITFPVSSFAQKNKEISDEPFVVYRVDEKQITLDDLNHVTNGKIEAFHAHEKVSAFLKEGNLYDAFSSMNFEGYFSENSAFSVQDKKQNFARGEIVCSGIDTFKSFVGYLVSPEKEKIEELYKCLSFSKASYLADEGEYFLEGGFSFPVLMKETKISFIPNKDFFSSFNFLIPSVKNIDFDLNKDAHQLDVVYQFINDKKITFSYDFIESYLPEFIQSPIIFLKNVLWQGKSVNFNLNEVVLPTLTGEKGLVFQGGLNSKKGVLNQSSLSLFSMNNQKILDVSYINDLFFVDFKYPVSKNYFIEGAFKNLNSDQAYSKISMFIINLLKNPLNAFSLQDMANFLSGLEVKNLTFYSLNNEKQAIFNFKFKEKITKEQLKLVQEDVKLLDELIIGDVILFKMSDGEMKISFDGTGAVSVNGKTFQGKEVADFYGILKYLQKQMAQSTKLYISQMGDVLDNVFILGPLYRQIELGLKVKNVLQSARTVALKNYTYCVSELEKEKIDFIFDCKGIEPNKISGFETLKTVEISLKNDANHSLIMTDKNTGRNLVSLNLKFKDQNLCDAVAKEKNLSCENNEINFAFPVDLKTY